MLDIMQKAFFRPYNAHYGSLHRTLPGLQVENLPLLTWRRFGRRTFKGLSTSDKVRCMNPSLSFLGRKELLKARA